MKTIRLNFESLNIGLFGLATEEYCLVGTNISQENVDKIKLALEVPVHQIKIAGTDLIGVFCVANKNCLIVPEIIFPEEITALEKLEIPFKIIKTHLTALGNNIIANDTGAVVNPEFSAVVKKEIRKALGVRVVPGTIGRMGNNGSHAICTIKGCLVSEEISQVEKTKLITVLQIPIVPGTVNEMQTVHAGLIANGNGYVFSSHLVRDEIFIIQDALYGEK